MTIANDLNQFIRFHGRKFSAFYFGLLATLSLAVVGVAVVGVVSKEVGDLVVALVTAGMTAIGTMCSLFLATNAAGDFAHRSSGAPAGAPPPTAARPPRESGLFPADGVPK